MKYTIIANPPTAHRKAGFDDIVLYRPTKVYDDRGFFEELFNFDELQFIPSVLRQISRSVNKKWVFRGMHYQPAGHYPGMGKVMHVRKGSATLFAIDIHTEASREPHIIYLSERDNGYLYAPWYYARGFITHEDDTEIVYFQEETVNEFASGVHYSVSPSLARYLEFWEPMMTISEKDRNARRF